MISRILAGVLILGLAPCVFAQKATERYIPITKSPGLTLAIVYRGTISATNPRTRTLSFRDAGRSHVVKVTDQTKIWLDRTETRRTNLTGDYSDCQEGRSVEVKFVDADKREVAEWIKVKVH